MFYSNDNDISRLTKIYQEMQSRRKSGNRRILDESQESYNSYSEKFKNDSFSEKELKGFYDDGFAMVEREVRELLEKHIEKSDKSLKGGKGKKYSLTMIQGMSDAANAIYEAMESTLKKIKSRRR